MRPLVPVLFAFISGIIAADFSGRPVPGVLFYIAFPLSLLPLALLHAFGRRLDRLAILPPFFLLGALFISPYIEPFIPYGHILNTIRTLEKTEKGGLGTPVEGIVLNVEGAGKRTRLLVQTQRVYDGDGWRDVSGKAFVTVQGRPEGIGRADRVRFVATLREPWNFGNPGEFDYKRWLADQSVFVTGFIKDEKLIVKTGAGGQGFLKSVDSLRASIGSFIGDSSVNNPEALKALIIAEQRGIEQDVKEAFSRTGTSHILSISGLHVGIVALFSFGVISFLLKRSERLMLAFDIKRAATFLTILPVVAYGLLAGFPVPTQRAVIMAVAFIISLSINRGRDIFNTIALSALLILMIAPYAVWDVSFQLTFAAMASIVYLVPRFTDLLGFEKEGKKKPGLPGLPGLIEGLIRRVIRRKLIPASIVTIAAGLGTSPIIAYHFHSVSLTGALANLVAVPLTSVIVPLLLLSSITLPISEWAALLFLHGADTVFEAALWTIKAFASIPYSSVWAGAPSLAGMLSFYGLVIGAVDFRRGRSYKAAAIISALVLTATLAYPYLKPAPGKLKVTFISVGQGDCSLIEFPDGKTMLVDGGGMRGDGFDTGEKIIAPLLSRKGIRKIDVMALTHTQLDHMGGLRFLAENFTIGEFWWNGDGSLGALGGSLDKNRVHVRTLSAGDTLNVGGSEVDVIHPEKAVQLDKNNNSLVFKLRYGQRAFLFTGDIGEEAEKRLLAKGLRADVLKSPHHGSRHSSSSAFVKAVSPGFVAISAGRHNSFGFPHEETLGRYEAAGAKVLRTDTGGALTVETDGKGLTGAAYLTEVLR